jgi:hypothetical protein
MVCPVQTAAIAPSIIQITLSWLKKPKSPGRSAWLRSVTAAHPVRVLPGRFSRKAKSETSPWHGRYPIAQGQLGGPLRRVNQFMLIFFRCFFVPITGECGREVFVPAGAVLLRSGRTRTRSRRGSKPQGRWKRQAEQAPTVLVRPVALRLAFRRSDAVVALPWVPSIPLMSRQRPSAHSALVPRATHDFR